MKTKIQILIFIITIVIPACQTKKTENIKSSNKVLYTEMVPQEFRKKVKEMPVAYLPLGTLEWHGEHLPLGSDGIQPDGIFKEIAAEIGGIVMPMLYLGPDRKVEENGIEYFGMDEGQYENDSKKQYGRQILAGSAYWISDTLFFQIIDATIFQLKRQGFKVIVAHGHGPSTMQVQKHAPYWEEKYDVKILNLWGSDNDEWFGFMCDHAGMTETSIIMKYRPELVQMENIPKDTNEWPVGIGGHDPRIYASAERGEEIVNKHKLILKKKIQDSLNQ